MRPESTGICANSSFPRRLATVLTSVFLTGTPSGKVSAEDETVVSVLTSLLLMSVTPGGSSSTFSTISLLTNSSLNFVLISMPLTFDTFRIDLTLVVVTTLYIKFPSVLFSSYSSTSVLDSTGPSIMS